MLHPAIGFIVFVSPAVDGGDGGVLLQIRSLSRRRRFGPSVRERFEETLHAEEQVGSREYRRRFVEEDPGAEFESRLLPYI